MVLTSVDLELKIVVFNCSVRFPASRFDIYKNNPDLYKEAVHNPNITSDIPNELKLLIRKLLSTDPNKRPSCNEILSKLRSFRRDDHATIFQDLSSECRNPSTATSPHVSPQSSTSSPSPLPGTSTDVTGNPTATRLTSSLPECSVEDNIDNEMFVEPDFKKQRLGSSLPIQDDSISHHGENSSSDSNHVLRRRRHLLNSAEDTIMEDPDAIDVQEPVLPPRLLLGSPDLVESSARWIITERRSIQAIKTASIVLKVCNRTEAKIS